MLFHRVILMSGSALSPWAVVRNPTRTTLQVASAFNCSISNSWPRGANDLVVGSPSGKKYSFITNAKMYHVFSVLFSGFFLIFAYSLLLVLHTGGPKRTLLQCLRSVPLHRLMQFRPASGSSFKPVWGPSYDGVVVDSFKHRMRDYLERMARYV